MKLDTFEGPHVRLSYEKLTRKSKNKLHECLQSWARWHVENEAPLYLEKCDSSLENGSFVYFPDFQSKTKDETVNGVQIWVDLPKIESKNVPETSETNLPLLKNNGFNSNYSSENSVPMYDRNENFCLDSTPNKNGSGDRNSEQSRCFNCSSYTHDLKNCPKPRNESAISLAREKHKLNKSGQGAGSVSGRYYVREKNSGSKHRNKIFSDLEPGKLAPELLEALSITEFDPPPWLGRMKELGCPPDYLGVEEEPGLIIFNDDHDLESDGQEGNGKSESEKERNEGLNAKGDKGSHEESNGNAGEYETEEGEIQEEQKLEVKVERRVEGSKVLDRLSTKLDSDLAQASTDPLSSGQDFTSCRFQYPGLNAPIPDGGDPSKWKNILSQAYTAYPTSGHSSRLNELEESRQSISYNSSYSDHRGVQYSHPPSFPTFSFASPPSVSGSWREKISSQFILDSSPIPTAHRKNLSRSYDEFSPLSDKHTYSNSVFARLKVPNSYLGNSYDERAHSYSSSHHSPSLKEVHHQSYYYHNRVYPKPYDRSETMESPPGVHSPALPSYSSRTSPRDIPPPSLRYYSRSKAWESARYDEAHEEYNHPLKRLRTQNPAKDLEPGEIQRMDDDMDLSE